MLALFSAQMQTFPLMRLFQKKDSMVWRHVQNLIQHTQSLYSPYSTFDDEQEMKRNVPN